jgi:hypothetical protein
MSKKPWPGSLRTGGDAPLTVGDIQDAIHGLDPDVIICFGGTIEGVPLNFSRFKMLDMPSGEKQLLIELIEANV